MKYYVIEYDYAEAAESPVTTARIVETSKSRVEQILLELLQYDTFHEVFMPQNTKVTTLDIPSPVKQSVIKDLLLGNYLKYAVSPKPDTSAPYYPENVVVEDEVMTESPEQEEVLPF